VPLLGSTTVREAWFVGFTDRFVAGVWLGNASSNRPMDGVSGGGLPASTGAQL
jgi:penicillin-binding protein 1A